MSLTRIGVGLAVATLAFAAGAQQQPSRKLYIVELADKPSAIYKGGVPGLAATAPAAGSRLNVASNNVRLYSAYLAGRQQQVLASVPGARVAYRFNHVLNGFSAALSDAELAQLVKNPAVRSVTVDTPMPMDTSRTPGFLGINQPGGAWSRTDAGGRLVKGEDVIIGHLDGGVWPENPSFSDKVDAVTGKPVASHMAGTVVYGAAPASWSGACQSSSGDSGASFGPQHCNNKLIGARFYNDIWKLAVSLGIVTTWSGEYLDSPRDPDGHGTHTLSTSGGNENVDVTIGGSPYTISGVAPRARVAAYKVCYTSANAADQPQQGSCFQGDSAAAAEQAVADGVHVINFSVGGSRTSVQDAVSTAFANAAFAGVFVSTSAGNSNTTGASTVAHVAPWTMTVGNSTHDRNLIALVTLGNGATASGASYQTVGLATKPLILSVDAGINTFASLSDPDKIALARCYTPADRADTTIPGNPSTAAAALDPAKVAGKIVVCYRGGNVLVNKAQSVQDAGGAGVIIQNIPGGLLPFPADTASGNTIPLVPFNIPGVHLLAADSAAVIGHAQTSGATAAFGPGVQTAGVVSPVMAGTSSRGPNQRDPHLLKPEITAPGSDIQAAYTNEAITPAERLQIIAGTLIPGPGAQSIGGTSMASPHVAGAAALLKQANPTWSPFAIKSALMTSTLQNVRTAAGGADTNRWGFGAGHLNPNRALDTQVVYDQTIDDHIAYYFGDIDGRTLNIASITHANVPTTATLRRTLTNKGSTSVTYNATAALAGFTVSVNPSSLTLAPGQSKFYDVTLNRTSAANETWVFGNVTWNGASLPTVFSPLSAKQTDITTTGTVTDGRNIGTKIYTAQFGFTGSLFTVPTGLTPATVKSGSVAVNARTCFPFSVPAGAKVLRLGLFNADTEFGSATDIDLILRRGGQDIASSLAGDSNETILIANPQAATTYEACAEGFATPGGVPVNFKLSYWVVGPTSEGTLKAFGPSFVRLLTLSSIGLSWNVPAGQRYAGLVEYRRTAAGAASARTNVFIDNAAAASASAQSNYAPVYRIKHPRVY